MSIRVGYRHTYDGIIRLRFARDKSTVGNRVAYETNDVYENAKSDYSLRTAIIFVTINIFLLSETVRIDINNSCSCVIMPRGCAEPSPRKSLSSGTASSTGSYFAWFCSVHLRYNDIAFRIATAIIIACNCCVVSIAFINIKNKMKCRRCCVTGSATRTNIYRFVRAVQFK